MIDLAELDMELGSETVKTPTVAARAKGKVGVLYFDIETIPDYDRAELFELEVIPPAAKRTPLNAINADTFPSEMLALTLAEFEKHVKQCNPCDEMLDRIDASERLSKKPRKGVFDITAELRNQDAAREALIVDQRKKMSVTPEMNRIVALGWSLNGETYSTVIDYDIITEETLLAKFWDLAKSAKSLCGYNILGFDLPTIFTRSILLDVAPSRQFDMKPWSVDVIDLMKKRFPSSQAIGLKKLAKLLGIPVPAGDVDGSQVEDLWKADPAKVGEYVRSDVDLLIELHQRYSGFFC